MNGKRTWDVISGYLNHCKEIGKTEDSDFLEKYMKNFRITHEYTKTDASLLKKLVITYIKSRLRPRQWDENKITDKIINDIIDNVEEKDFSNHFVTVYKLDKTLNAETKFGDIAFIVRFKTDTGKYIEGVGFIEAKRDYQNKNYKYDYLKKDQMDKFIKNTNQSFYCFYSHNKFFPVISTNFLIKHLENLNITTSQYSDNDIYSLITPLTLVDQINRFINGYDLDFSKQTLDIAKGKKSDVGYSSLVIDYEINYDTLNPEPTPNNVNKDLYKKYQSESINIVDDYINDQNNNNDSGVTPRHM